MWKGYGLMPLSLLLSFERGHVSHFGQPTPHQSYSVLRRSFIYSFKKYLFEYLLSGQYCSGYWDYTGEQNKVLALKQYSFPPWDSGDFGDGTS